MYQYHMIDGVCYIDEYRSGINIDSFEITNVTESWFD